MNKNENKTSHQKIKELSLDSRLLSSIFSLPFPYKLVMKTLWKQCVCTHFFTSVVYFAGIPPTLHQWPHNSKIPISMNIYCSGADGSSLLSWTLFISAHLEIIHQPSGALQTPDSPSSTRSSLWFFVHCLAGGVSSLHNSAPRVCYFHSVVSHQVICLCSQGR